MRDLGVVEGGENVGDADGDVLGALGLDDFLAGKFVGEQFGGGGSRAGSRTSGGGAFGGLGASAAAAAAAAAPSAAGAAAFLGLAGCPSAAGFAAALSAVYRRRRLRVWLPSWEPVSFWFRQPCDVNC